MISMFVFRRGCPPPLYFDVYVSGYFNELGSGGVTSNGLLTKCRPKIQFRAYSESKIHPRVSKGFLICLDKEVDHLFVLSKTLYT